MIMYPWYFLLPAERAPKFAGKTFLQPGGLALVIKYFNKNMMVAIVRAGIMAHSTPLYFIGNSLTQFGAYHRRYA